MKIYQLPYLLFFSAVISLNSCSSISTGNSKSDTGEGLTSGSQYTYYGLLKSREKIMKDFSWPDRHELDLNDDGINEIFLAAEGYSRGMNYALFGIQNKAWVLLSGDEDIPSGHLGVEKLADKNKGWHDFVAYQPSGRGGVIESYFTWNGKQYVFKDQKEIQNN